MRKGKLATLIIGELLNTNTREIYEAALNRNDRYIEEIARAQADKGVNYLDIKCDTFVDNEEEIMSWLADVVQRSVPLPLCFDTANSKVAKACLKKHRWGRPMLNGITAESDLFTERVSIALEHKAKVIARCINDQGIPKTVMERMVIAGNLIKDLNHAGFRDEDIYVDPYVKSICLNDQEGIMVLKSIRLIKQEYPKVHVVCGLSNISYGMPNRSFLNGLFLAQAIAAGMDSFILNPLDSFVANALSGAEALTGHDPASFSYIKNQKKEGRF